MRETMGAIEIKNLRYGYSSHWRCGAATGRLTLCYFIDDMNTLHYGWALCHEWLRIQDTIYPIEVRGGYKVTAIARGDQFKKIIGRGRAYQGLLNKTVSIMHDPEYSPIKEILSDIERTTSLVYVTDLPKLSELA